MRLTCEVGNLPALAKAVCRHTASRRKRPYPGFPSAFPTSENSESVLSDAQAGARGHPRHLSHAPQSPPAHWAAFRMVLEPDHPSLPHPPARCSPHPSPTPAPPMPPTHIPLPRLPRELGSGEQQGSQSCYIELRSCQFSALNLLMASRLRAKGRVLKMTDKPLMLGTPPHSSDPIASYQALTSAPGCSLHGPCTLLP